MSRLFHSNDFHSQNFMLIAAAAAAAIVNVMDAMLFVYFSTIRKSSTKCDQMLSCKNENRNFLLQIVHIMSPFDTILLCDTMTFLRSTKHI